MHCGLGLQVVLAHKLATGNCQCIHLQLKGARAIGVQVHFLKDVCFWWMGLIITGSMQTGGTDALCSRRHRNS